MVASISGLLVLLCPGQRDRAMVQLADQLHRAFEGMDVTISVIADVHHVPTVWQLRSWTSSSHSAKSVSAGQW